jgi:hypothetical protein
METGLAPYQDPQRNDQTLLSANLDHFSALVIYVALRALAADTSSTVASDVSVFRLKRRRSAGVRRKPFHLSAPVRTLRCIA